MAANIARKNGHDLPPVVAVQMPDTNRQVPRHGKKSPKTGAAKGSRIPQFKVVLLALTLAYVLFTVGTMVPQARAHFLHLIINPAPAHFLKAE